MDEYRHDNAVSGTVNGPALQARDINAGAIIMQPPARVPAVRTPRQLPDPCYGWFVNRGQELSTLDTLAASPKPTRVVVTGPGGIGKSALAVHWLAQKRSDHADGELYTDLAGWTNLPPPAPEHVLAGWVRALGFPAEDIPSDLAEMVAFYRTVTAGLSLLILVDNAHSAAQVLPLLPTSPTSIILVTSRHRLTRLALAGFRHLDVDCLSTEDGTALLTGILDDCAPDDSTLLEALAEQCLGLPLTLAIAGGYLTVHSQRSPATLLARLASDRRRLLELNLGDVSLGAILDRSYQDLDADLARLYRLCALHPGPEFTIGPLAAAWDRPVSDTERAFATLVEANLINERVEGRYRLHDMVRDHAHDLVERLDPLSDRDLAHRRMISWYLQRLASADLALNPLQFAPRFGSVFKLIATSDFADATAALSWFELERATILACQQLAADRGWHEHVYQLAEAVWNGLRPNYNATALVQSQLLGVDAARHSSQHVLEAVCLVRVAFAETNRGHHAAAIAASTAALEIAIVLNHPWAQPAALSTRARAHLAADDPHAALVDVRRALKIDEQQADNQRSIALRHRRLGQIYSHPAVADYPKAVEHLRHAATLMRTVGDQVGHSRVIIFLAHALLRTGQARTALSELIAVVDTVRSYGSRGYIADLCTALGRSHAHLNHAREADRWYTEAIDLYTAAGPGASSQREAAVLLRHELAPPHTDRGK